MKGSWNLQGDTEEQGAAALSHLHVRWHYLIEKTRFHMGRRTTHGMTTKCDFFPSKIFKQEKQISSEEFNRNLFVPCQGQRWVSHSSIVSVNKKILGSSERAPVVVHQYLETWEYESSWADWHIGRQSAKDIITGMTLSHSLVYSLVITLQRRHTTDHDNWRCLAQMLRPQNVICKLGSIRQLNNSRSCLRYKSRRWVSREAPTDELNHPFYDKV